MLFLLVSIFIYVDLLGAVIRKGLLKADKTLLCFFYQNGLENWGQVLGKCRNICFRPRFRNGCGTHSAFYAVGTESRSLDGKLTDT